MPRRSTGDNVKEFNASDSGKAMNVNLEIFMQNLDAMAEELTAAYLPPRGEDESDEQWGAREADFARTQQVLDDCLRRVAGHADALSEADTEAQRNSLKAQKSGFDKQLVTARLANGVQLQNQKAEMEHSYVRKLQEKVASLSSDDGQAALLAEALEREQQVKKKLEFEKERAEKNGEKFKAATDQLQAAAEASEAAEAAAEAEIADLKAKLEEVRRLSESAEARVAEGAAEGERLQSELDQALAFWPAELERQVGMASKQLTDHRIKVSRREGGGGWRVEGGWRK